MAVGMEKEPDVNEFILDVLRRHALCGGLTIIVGTAAVPLVAVGVTSAATSNMTAERVA
jgi:hypothetical protein